MKDNFWKIVATSACSVLSIVFIGWIGWISIAVVNLSNSQRVNTAQWEALKELREADKVLVARIAILEGRHD